MTKSVDFSKGVRGMFAGRKIRIVGATDVRRRTNPPALVVEIDNDVRHRFPDAAAVNEALRVLAAEFDRKEKRNSTNARRRS